MEYIEAYERADGIGNWGMEDMPHAKAVLQNMNAFHDVFRDDPMVQGGDPIREFSIEYFIISMYLLLRHLRTYYVMRKTEGQLFREFVIDFYQRWRDARSETDTDILIFSDNRQQSAAAIQIRDRIVRQAFFQHAAAKEHQMLTKDDRRSFSEAQRIEIYRRDKGLCQECLAEGKPEKEAQVPWGEYEADHVIPHSAGGETLEENAQLLCRYHNRQKGAG
jgi:hypothetical protein